MRLSATLAALLLLLLAACGNARDAQVHDDDPSPLAASGDGATEDTTAQGSDSSAPGSALVPRTSQGTPVNAAPGTPAPSAAGAGISWTLPESWQEQQPSSRMRLAQATIPGEAGAAELTVFYFGPGGGGGVEANLQRWVSQMEVAAGTEPERGQFDSQDLNVSWIEVAGTLRASTMGTGPTTDQPNSRLLGAVVEGPGGPWFFKATGPDTTLTAQRTAFMELLRSVRRVGDV